MGFPTRLVCALCNRVFPPAEPLSFCPCAGPLLVEYDFSAIRRYWGKESLPGSTATLWRYAPVLPAAADEAVTLGEGWTTLRQANKLGSEFGLSDLWIKDESGNPTASFKARGFSAAVTMAKKFGLRKLVISSAGNAASALAAYAASADLEAHIFMPDDALQSNFIECSACGAHITLVDGLISDCHRVVAQRKQQEGWFEVNAFQEPYRIEGEKTIGYELAEQFDWRLPDAIVYPCGSGSGFVALWKAFSELQALGWIGSKRPKMVAVQAAGCAPIVRAFEQRSQASDFWNDAHTVAAGLRVSKSSGDFLVLRAIYESGGAAVAVPDEDMLDAALLLAKSEGLLAAPETGACVAALKSLFNNSFIKPHEKIVIVNTASGLRYLETYSTRLARNALTQHEKLGGLITPR